MRNALSLSKGVVACMTIAVAALAPSIAHAQWRHGWGHGGHHGGRPGGHHGRCQDGTGKFGPWTAEWWIWVYSLPVSNNPLFDETGDLADTDQPNPKAFYLVGVINESNTAERSITINRRTPLFGPIINYQNDNVFNGDNPLSVPELRAQAAEIVDGETYFLELDGCPRPDLAYRVKSPVFAYYLPATDNIYQYFGTNIAGWVYPAVSDGYWFYIPPLPRGQHTLRFGGANADNSFSLEIVYHITVK